MQVLTIHGAKGLEFDHVLVPGLDRDLNRGREPLLRWLELPRPEEGSDLIMAPAPVIGEQVPGEVNTYLKRLMAGRAGQEQIRLLYVAATRARRSLHLYAAPKPRADGLIAPRSRTLLATSVAGARGGFPQPRWPPRRAGDSRSAPRCSAAARCEDSRPDGSRVGLPPAPPLARLPLAQRSLEPPEFSWAGETRRHIGTVVHAALQSFAAAAELPAREQLESQVGVLSASNSAASVYPSAISGRPRPTWSKR